MGWLRKPRSRGTTPPGKSGSPGLACRRGEPALRARAAQGEMGASSRGFSHWRGPGRPVSQHQLPHGFDVGAFTVDLSHDLSLEGHYDAIAQRQHLGQLSRDEYHRATSIALSEKHLVDRLNRTQIQAP